MAVAQARGVELPKVEEVSDRSAFVALASEWNAVANFFSCFSVY